jgi:hypothetical protein
MRHRDLGPPLASCTPRKELKIKRYPELVLIKTGPAAEVVDGSA